MHAKKSILLYCTNVEVLSSTAFALRLHPYEVVAKSEVKEALALAAGQDGALAAAVLVHLQQGDPTGRLIHLLLESESHVPLLLVDRAGDLAPVRYADIVLYGRNTTMAHILAGLTALCARRPGPPTNPLFHGSNRRGGPPSRGES